MASVSDAQIEGKVSVTPKSWLLRNNMITYHNTFAASTLLAHGHWSTIARGTKNVRDQPIHGLFLCTLWNIHWKCSLEVSCQFMANQAGSTNWHSTIDRSIAIDLLATLAIEQRFSNVFMLRHTNAFWIWLRHTYFMKSKPTFHQPCENLLFTRFTAWGFVKT